jgi:FAD/FMN-containing dehydrogenase
VRRRARPRERNVGVTTLSDLAEEVGPIAAGPVTVAGHATREGGVPGVRCVRAPSGVEWFQPEEMTVSCGAGTSVTELQAVVAERGQYVNLPDGGTVGGALAMGWSHLLRLGRGPVRDVLLQARYVSAAGEIVTAGGPTVKNVTGFDLCRVLVGSRGTLGIIGDVIVRTRPRPLTTSWFLAPAATDPFALARLLFRPSAVLWDGTNTWVCLEGHPTDVAAEADRCSLTEVDSPPTLPEGGRWSMPPADIQGLDPRAGRFVAEIGVGIVHHEHPRPTRPVDPVIHAIETRLRAEFDPTGRLSPGRL